MPHLIRDVAEEGLKDFLLSKVIRLETGEYPVFDRTRRVLRSDCRFEESLQTLLFLKV
jgi:hypothetical protein